ncbi:MAG: hypothetical protein RXN88_03935 [Acidilobus sp.]|jgi:hypothetical protein
MSSSDQEKVDVNKMLSFIPSASTIYSKKSRISEKRVKLVHDQGVEQGTIKLSKNLASELGIVDEVELAVGGKLRLRFKVAIDDSIGDDTTVWANPDEMKERGVADGSTVTVRAPR